MKKIIYIVFILCLIACKQNDAKQMESLDTEAIPTIEDDFDREILSSEIISTKKLEEFMDLIKLKQEHPEFEDEITVQLKNYTSNYSLALKYPNDFSISNIKQVGESKVISDTTELLVLGYIVTTNAETFRDYISTEIITKPINIDGETRVSKKIRFLKFSEK